MSEIRRLNWGCGSWVEPGWINSDIKPDQGAELVGDIRDGLSLGSESIDYAVSIHALPEFTVAEIVPVLTELLRVLKPGGVLRLALPDLFKAIHAYQQGDKTYFLIPDRDARSLGAKLVMQMLWYGYSKTVFTGEFIEEMLLKAGFAEVRHCSYRVTKSEWPEIVTLDNRERESLYVEGYKQAPTVEEG
jgi:predicted SAM-dependent methyltransferase